MFVYPLSHPRLLSAHAPQSSCRHVRYDFSVLRHAYLEEEMLDSSCEGRQERER